mgnify:CR=1 FL=1
MIINQQILRLNSAGYPTAWISHETAARLYYTDQIAYECGSTCLFYTSDAADDSLRVALGGRRIITTPKQPQTCQQDALVRRTRRTR